MAHGYKYIIEEYEQNLIGGPGYAKWDIEPKNDFDVAIKLFEDAIRQGRKVRFVQLISPVVMFTSETYDLREYDDKPTK